MVIERPLAQQLHEKLERIIAKTEPGERLPSEPNLAQELGVSRASLREAMRIFETQGLILRRQGVGTFVIHSTPVIQSGLEVLESIKTMSKRLDLQVSTSDIDFQTSHASREEAKYLGVGGNTEVIRISRVIRVEGQPVAYLIDTVNKTIFNPAESLDDFDGSVLDHLLQRGDPLIGSSQCEIGTISASQTVADALSVTRGEPLLHFKSTLFSVEGKVVDYSLSYFLPGYFRFHVIRRVG